ncbi:MAG: hypothetical protein R3Y64_00200 [Peptostreptococcaceae bacterium]
MFYPESIEYFKEELISEVIVLPQNRPDIKRVLDISVWPEVLKTHLVETKVGTSNEGQHLSGLKLVVDLKLKQKISYVADEPTQSVHAQAFEYYKSMFVILPQQINNVDVYDLVRSGRLQVTPYIEAVKFRLQDPRSVHKCVMIFLDVRS